MHQLAHEYPKRHRRHIEDEIPRHSAHLELVMEYHEPGTPVLDLGGGTGLFALAATAHGYPTTVVDDFGDSGVVEDPDDLPAMDPHRKYGVRIVARDFIANGLDFESEEFGAVTAFETMEHWHHSPKRLFRDAMYSLRPRGTLLIGVPNAVNLRKRITVPLGHGKWSSMEDWYEADQFRGHVREPDLDDLRYIAADLRLEDVRTFGFNWQGYRSPRPWVRSLCRWVDRPLRKFPTLCADIYVMGVKPCK